MPIKHDIERSIVQIEGVGQDAHLASDLAGGQVSDQAHLSGQTKGTPHRATDLCRNAERLRRGIRDENRLDLLVVFQCEDELLCAVLGDITASRSRCVGSLNSAASCPRSGRPKSVINAMSVTPRFQIQRKI